MRATWAIARRELASYFTSPLAYVIIALFLIVDGYFFVGNVVLSRQASVDNLFLTMFTILLLLTPALTMRLLAEEQKTGTIELLLTSPVSEWHIVLGKFLAGFLFIAAMIGATAVFPILLSFYGNPDPGPIIAGYVGALLFGAAAVAVGLFASSLTQNQIIAAVLTFTILILLWVFDGIDQVLPGTVGQSLAYASLYPHFTDLVRGVIDTRDVLFFLTFVAGALFLTWRSLEARRWRL